MLSLPAPLKRLLAGVALTLLAVLAIQCLHLTPQFVLTRNLMLQQDLPVLVLTCALLLVIAWWGLPAALAGRAEKWAGVFAAAQPRAVSLVILGAGVIAALGTRFVALDFAISRDEMMALFDAEIFGSGRLLAPVAPEWRPFVPALHPDFRLPVPGHVAWVSTYLPGNAAVRAVLGKVFNGALINAIIVMMALAALHGVARRLWPERLDAQALAVILAATSSQVLCMAMTPFAMSTHLALNTIWLWLFLRNTTASHACCVAIGVLATGLHQIIFHPLFVAPFIVQLLLERRWRTAGFYIASYAAIGVFWIVYWQLLLSGHGIMLEAKAGGGVGVAYFISRVTALLQYFSFYGLETMAQNLLRFAAWQNPLLLILLVPGVIAAWQLKGVLRSLAAGILLTIVAMFILLPNQDIGWGYRYVHGLIGGAALLGAQGWIALTAVTGQRALVPLIVMLTAFSGLILLPLHAAQMHAHIAPFARAQAAIAKIDAEAVVVETVSAYYGIDFVRNDPFLRNRPLVFDIGELDEALTRELCARMRVAMFDGRDAAKFGVQYTDPTTHPAWAQMQKVRTLVESEECRRLLRRR